jgi:hypothetical protein
VFAEALVTELGSGLDDWLAISDRVLRRLYASGYVVAPIPKEAADE